MRKILALVHCERAFELYTEKHNFEYKLAKTIFTQDYDEIMVFNSEIENSGNINIVESLIFYKPKPLKVVAWGWGYEEKDSYDEDDPERNYVIESQSIHEWTWIPPELRNLPDDVEFLVCGGCEDECLLDFTSILDYYEIQYSVEAYF